MTLMDDRPTDRPTGVQSMDQCTNESIRLRRAIVVSRLGHAQAAGRRRRRKRGGFRGRRGGDRAPR